MKTHNTLWLVCATLVCTFSVHANAQTAPTPSGVALDGKVTQTASLEQQKTTREIDFMNPVSSATLAGYRGGASVTNSEMTLSGLTAGNTAVNVVTGTNTIGMGAFANMSGLPLVVQNSGANVLIQNAVILNLQMN